MPDVSCMVYNYSPRSSHTYPSTRSCNYVTTLHSCNNEALRAQFCAALSVFYLSRHKVVNTVVNAVTHACRPTTQFGIIEACVKEDYVCFQGENRATI